MPIITDAQVEVAFDTYWAVVALEGDENRKAMRAALEAYERVRDVDRILSGNPAYDALTDAEKEESAIVAARYANGDPNVSMCVEGYQGRANQVQIREDDARVEQALESLRHKVREGYQR